MNAPHPDQFTSLSHIAMIALEDLLAHADGTAAPEVGRVEVGADASGLAARVKHLRENPPAIDRDLIDIGKKIDLSDIEMLAIALAIKVENEPGFAHAISSAQQPVGGSRLLIGLLSRAFANLGADPVSIASGNAVQSGFLTLGDEAAPLPERSIYLPSDMAAALAGRWHERNDYRALSVPRIQFSSSQLEHIDRLSKLLASEKNLLVVIRSALQSEGRAIASMLAGKAGYNPAQATGETAGPAAAWLHAVKALPVHIKRLAVGERWEPPEAPLYYGPQIILTGLDGAVEWTGPIEEWQVSLPDESERTRLWRQAGLEKTSALRAAQTYRQGAGRISEIARAISRKAGNDGASVNFAEIQKQVTKGARELDVLAHRCEARQVEEKALILPGDLKQALDRFRRRARIRGSLADRLGPAMRARYSPGIRALMCGESGTGKTMAAHWLSTRLGLPLYRVDMAALTSKWIGETEKNLSELLSVAEHCDVILFFDEADSLFGARTDVSDSNDRFANAQTNFLLQRIEEFDGIALLSTNGRDRFDPAFVRRLDAIMEFPLPDAGARKKLWKAHLGDGHDLSNDDIARLAIEVDIAGGHIRNVVLGAAVRANLDDSKVGREHLAQALIEECEKLGRPKPHNLWG